MKITKFGIAVALTCLALLGVVVYFSFAKVTDHPVETIHFKGNLSKNEQLQVQKVIEPLIAKGYYLLNKEEIIKTIHQINWVAKASVGQSLGFGLDLNVEKDEVLFLFNQSQYLNQYLKPKKITKEFEKTIAANKPVHLHSTEKQIKEAVHFYNSLLKKMNATQSAASLEVKKMTITAIDQMVMDVVLKNERQNVPAQIHFGKEKIEQRMDNFVLHLDEIMKQLADYKVIYRSSSMRLDLRYPKGFSIEEIRNQ